MYGFMCVAATAAIWDNTASYLGLPVSTTHTTGAALCLPYLTAVPRGPALLDWQWRRPASLLLGTVLVT